MGSELPSATITAGTRTDDLPTPSVVVDLDVLERNAARMARLAEQAGVALRPMVKTHKSAHIVALQRRLGSTGFLTATLGEAEALVALGVDDVTIAYPPVSSGSKARVRALAESATVTLSVDSAAAVELAAEAAEGLEHPLRALILIDSGNHRLGVTAGEAPSLAARISRAGNLDFAGVSTHAGHAYGAATVAEVEAIAHQEAEAVLAAAAALRAAGHPCETVAVGATPTARFNAHIPGLTEIRPGNYVFHDAMQVALGTCGEEECALRVIATVVSVPAPGRAVIDAGSKTLSSDLGAHGISLVSGYGRVVGRPDTQVERISEELGVLADESEPPLAVGDRVELIPNHACTVANLTSRLIGVREGRVAEILPVLARH